ncbi:MAG: DUF167 domain-containing protein [Parcubacteria group bacterium]
MNLVSVKVFPNASKKSVVKKTDGVIEIRLTASPEKGKANKMTAEILANFFGVPVSQIKLVKGARNRNKLFSV